MVLKRSREDIWNVPLLFLFLPSVFDLPSLACDGGTVRQAGAPDNTLTCEDNSC